MASVCNLLFVFREDDSEDEMEENAAAARKLGMSTINKPEVKKRTDHTLSMMLQRQAQVAKAKADGTLGSSSSVGAKRKPEKTADVSFDDLLADFDAPASVPTKKQSAFPRVAPRVCSVYHTNSPCNMPPGFPAITCSFTLDACTTVRL